MLITSLNSKLLLNFLYILQSSNSTLEKKDIDKIKEERAKWGNK